MRMIFVLVFLFPIFVKAQGYDSVKHDTYLRDHPYWTIWFKLSKPSKEFMEHYDSTKCIACDSMKYHPHSEWVQSMDDSASAFKYYWHLRSDGKVLMWQNYECEVDKSSVYIDKYDMILRKYIGIDQPKTVR